MLESMAQYENRFQDITHGADDGEGIEKWKNPYRMMHDLPKNSGMRQRNKPGIHTNFFDLSARLGESEFRKISDTSHIRQRLVDTD